MSRTRLRPESDVGPDVHEHQPLEPRGKVRAVLDGDATAHGMADQAEALEPQRVGEGGQVVGHGGDAIVRVMRRLAVAVAALIEGQNPEGRREPLGGVVPHACVPGDAVEENDGRGAGRAPVRVVEAEAVDLHGAIGKGHGLTQSNRRGARGQLPARAAKRRHSPGTPLSV
jgi:hypothetical protein